jgi:hypothetical protein
MPFHFYIIKKIIIFSTGEFMVRQHALAAKVNDMVLRVMISIRTIGWIVGRGL